eukprot:TRINITY_DN73065_c0_g1_i1.p1 TRINITY_DN73065_c0_g1~~TRINITY_DN73065_c0_g1_i1.p1  ORF type:complete len:462 (-),score=126.20 TRINITY_DN73065_c0_g1_i1:83-1375(-)
MDYSKWDNLEDSDEEREKSNKGLQVCRDEEDRERRRGEQAGIDRWLKRQISLLEREESEEAKRGPSSRSARLGGGMREQPSSAAFAGSFGMFGSSGFGSSVGSSDHLGGGYGGEIDRPKLRPYRQVTKEEREVLAMLVAVSDFEEHETNLVRHPQILDLVRQHRWLEQDPGSLELLCRIHNACMKRAGNKDESQNGPHDNSEDGLMRAKLLCAINTLAAAPQAKVEGGLLDLMTQICTPETAKQKDMRKKWQAKDYGKDALMDSLFPEFRLSKDGDQEETSNWEIWLLVALMVVMIAGIGALVWHISSLTGARRGKNATETTLAAVANASSAVASAVTSAVGKSAGAGAAETAAASLVSGAGAAVAAGAASAAHAAGGGAEAGAAPAGGDLAAELARAQARVRELEAQAAAAAARSTAGSSADSEQKAEL